MAEALGINPDMAAAQVNLALSFAMSGQGASAIRLIQPLASSPNASMKVRHDYAAVLAMSGRREEAERILSVDLSPAEVRQVMAEFEQAGRRGNADPGMAAPPPPPPSNPVAPAGSRPRGGTPNTSLIPQPSPHFFSCDSKAVGLDAKSPRHLQREAGPTDRVIPRVT